MLKILAKIRRTAKIIFWAVIFVALLVGVVAGWNTIGRWLAALGGGIAALIGGMKAAEKKELGRIKEKNQDIKEAIEKQEDIKTDLDSQTESWREKVNKLRRGSLVLIICAGLCLAASPVRAEDLYIPDDYDELRTLYIQSIEQSIELLDEADQIILEYQSLVTDQANTIQEQADMIDKLQDNVARLSTPAWGLVGGIVLDDSARWRLGVARKSGILSFGGGVGGGDKFSLWGEIGLWAR